MYAGGPAGGGGGLLMLRDLEASFIYFPQRAYDARPEDFGLSSERTLTRVGRRREARGVVDPRPRQDGRPLLPRQRREHQPPSGAREAPGRVARPRRLSRGLPRLRDEQRKAGRGRPLRGRRGDLPGRRRARVPARSDRALRGVPRQRRRDRDGPAAPLPGADPRDAVPVGRRDGEGDLPVRARRLSSARGSTTRRRSRAWPSRSSSWPPKETTSCRPAMRGGSSSSRRRRRTSS